MKKIILLVALVSFTISFAQTKSKIKGNKVVIEVNKDISNNFNAIEVDDALEIQLTQSTKNSYFLKTDENLVDIIKFSVSDSILKIYTTHKIVSDKKLEISLNFKEIKHIILKNDSKVKGKGKITSNKIYLSAYNSSRFDLDLKADDIIVTLQRDAGGKIKTKSKNTTIIMNDRTDLKAFVIANKTRITQTKSSELSLDGNSDFAAINLKDSAKLKAEKMKVASVDLYTSNSSDVHVYASRNLELYAQGKSNIYVYGNPNVEIKGLTDKSKLIKK